MKTLLTAIALSTIGATAASAGGMDTLKANSEVQRDRIEQGRMSGELTRREYRELKAEQARIDQDLRNATADGRLSKREYNQIHREQTVAYRDIAGETHDKQKSWLRRWLYVTRN